MTKFHYDEPDWDDRVVEAAVIRRFKEGRSRPSWRYPVPRAYNGTDGHLRIAGWQIMWGAVNMGICPPPLMCSVCLKKGRHQYHNENYFRPASARPVCRSCHQAIHSRFNKPQQWRKLVVTCSYDGAWFTDIATKRELRREESYWLSKKDNPIAAGQLREYFDLRMNVTARSRRRS